MTTVIESLIQGSLYKKRHFKVLLGHAPFKPRTDITTARFYQAVSTGKLSSTRTCY